MKKHPPPSKPMTGQCPPKQRGATQAPDHSQSQEDEDASTNDNAQQQHQQETETEAGNVGVRIPPTRREDGGEASAVDKMKSLVASDSCGGGDGVGGSIAMTNKKTTTDLVTECNDIELQQQDAAAAAAVVTTATSDNNSIIADSESIANASLWTEEIIPGAFRIYPNGRNFGRQFIMSSSSTNSTSDRHRGRGIYRSEASSTATNGGFIRSAFSAEVVRTTITTDSCAIAGGGGGAGSSSSRRRLWSTRSTSSTANGGDMLVVEGKQVSNSKIIRRLGILIVVIAMAAILIGALGTCDFFHNRRIMSSSSQSTSATTTTKNINGTIIGSNATGNGYDYSNNNKETMQPARQSSGGGIWIPYGLEITLGDGSLSSSPSIAISNDGSNIGITDGNTTLVFKYIDGNWIQLGDTILTPVITLDDDEKQEASVMLRPYSSCVSLNGDGSIVATCQSRSSYSEVSDNSINGSVSIPVYQYQDSTSSWIQFGPNVSNINSDLDDSIFGYTVALSDSGYQLAVGLIISCNDTTGIWTGDIYTYSYNDIIRIWEPMGVTQPFVGNINGRFDVSFGSSIVLSEDGNRLAVSSFDVHTNGRVKVLGFDGSQWSQIGLDLSGSNDIGFGGAGDNHNATGIDQFGVAIDLKGDTIAIRGDANGSGYVRVYRLDDVAVFNDKTAQTWVQMGTDVACDSSQDIVSVYLSVDGKRIACNGELLEFDEDNGVHSWNHLLELSTENSDEGVAEAVALSADGSIFVVASVSSLFQGHVTTTIKAFVEVPK